MSGNPNVFFDISIGGSPAGRIVMELFKDQVPKVCLFMYPAMRILRAMTDRDTDR
jgi:hypothetical protein